MSLSSRRRADPLHADVCNACGARETNQENFERSQEDVVYEAIVVGARGARVYAARVGVAFVALLAAAPASAQSPPTVTAKTSSFGRILFDGRGFVLYGFTRDSHRRSACTGACARAWPPYIVKLRPRASSGAAARLLGTTRRANGSLQVTYAGRPLYYYVGDRQPGQILCQNVTEFGGVWRVVRPSGRLVG
jgi:predicted lipoprotein with Yx(FWY)xxD motif